VVESSALDQFREHKLRPETLKWEEGLAPGSIKSITKYGVYTIDRNRYLYFKEKTIPVENLGRFANVEAAKRAARKHFKGFIIN
jgi:hypothetical protein